MSVYLRILLIYTLSGCLQKQILFLIYCWFIQWQKFYDINERLSWIYLHFLLKPWPIKMLFYSTFNCIFSSEYIIWVQSLVGCNIIIQARVKRFRYYGYIMVDGGWFVVHIIVTNKVISSKLKTQIFYFFYWAIGVFSSSFLLLRLTIGSCNVRFSVE